MISGMSAADTSPSTPGRSRASTRRYAACWKGVGGRCQETQGQAFVAVLAVLAVRRLAWQPCEEAATTSPSTGTVLLHLRLPLPPPHPFQATHQQQLGLLEGRWHLILLDRGAQAQQRPARMGSCGFGFDGGFGGSGSLWGGVQERVVLQPWQAPNQPSHTTPTEQPEPMLLTWPHAGR